MNPYTEESHWLNLEPIKCPERVTTPILRLNPLILREMEYARIRANRPLTDTERADLAQILEDIARENQEMGEGRVLPEGRTSFHE